MNLFYYILSLFSIKLHNRHKLVTNNIGYFNYIFNEKFSNVFPITIKEDLRQESYYGFVKAANNFSPLLRRLKARALVGCWLLVPFAWNE